MQFSALLIVILVQSIEIHRIINVVVKGFNLPAGFVIAEHFLCGFVQIVSCAFLLIVMKPMSPAFINGKTATVLNVYTLPAYRRRGYARMLMNAMIADAKELNIDVIELKATEDGYDLYRSVGFEDDRSKYHLMKWKAQREA